MVQLNRQTRTPSAVQSQSRQILQNLLHLHNSQQGVGAQPLGPQSRANIHRRQLQQFYLHKLFDSISDAEFLPLIPGSPAITYNKFPENVMKQNHNMGMSPIMSSHGLDGPSSYNMSDIRNGVKVINDDHGGFNTYAQNSTNLQNHLLNSFARQQSLYDNNQNKRMGGQFLQQHLFGGKRQDYTQYKQDLQN